MAGHRAEHRPSAPTAAPTGLIAAAATADVAADAALLRAYEDATPVKDVDGGPEPLDLGELTQPHTH